MNGPDAEAVTLGLRVLAWTVADTARADRLLALTGLTADALRARAAEPALLAAVIQFLEAHEPDLIACAEALDEKPETLVAAARSLAA
jgi:hypothetical protein